MVDPQRPVPARHREPVDDPSGIVDPSGVVRHHIRRDAHGLAGANVVRERKHPLIPDVAGTFHQLTLRARIVKQHIGDRTPLLLGCLSGDPRASVRLVHPALDQPLDPGLLVGVDDDHERKHRRQPGLDEQRDVLDHHRVLGDGGDDLLTPARHQRVHDAVEELALFVVDERLGRQGGPVQCAVGKQDVVAERVDKGRQTLGPGFDDFPGDHVSVDDDAAAFVERGGHRRFTGADAAGQTDANHPVNAD